MQFASVLSNKHINNEEEQDWDCCQESMQTQDNEPPALHFLLSLDVLQIELKLVFSVDVLLIIRLNIVFKRTLRHYVKLSDDEPKSNSKHNRYVASHNQNPFDFTLIVVFDFKGESV